VRAEDPPRRRGDPAAPELHISPRIDRALDALAAAWDPAERAKLAPELAAGLAETWPLAGIVADAPRGSPPSPVRVLGERGAHAGARAVSPEGRRAPITNKRNERGCPQE
jgi:hypothetical protein